MAGTDFGGRMRFRTSGGAFLTLRATFNIMPAGKSVDGIVGQDGSVDRVITPTMRRVEFTFADRDVDTATMMDAPRQPMTIIEEETGKQHLLDNAFFAGEPTINRLTGEVSGMSAIAEGIERLVG